MPQSALLKILDPVFVAFGPTHSAATVGGIFVAIGFPIAGGTGVFVGNDIAMSVAIVLVVGDGVVEGRLWLVAALFVQLSFQFS